MRRVLSLSLVLIILCFTGWAQQTFELGCDAQIKITSNSMRGYSVYVDGDYIGGDGSSGDRMDGTFAFTVTGNQPHTINVYDQGFMWAQTNIYNCGQTYTLHV